MAVLRTTKGTVDVQIDVGPTSQGTVTIDGVDMSAYIRSVEFRAEAGGPTSLLVEFGGVQVNASVEGLEVADVDVEDQKVYPRSVVRLRQPEGHR